MAAIIDKNDSRHPAHPDYRKSERESAALDKKQKEQLAEIRANEAKVSKFTLAEITAAIVSATPKEIDDFLKVSSVLLKPSVKVPEKPETEE